MHILTSDILLNGLNELSPFRHQPQQAQASRVHPVWMNETYRIDISHYAIN